jgi:hypothetical protein
MIASKSAGQADICSAMSTTQRVQITDLKLASPGKRLSERRYRPRSDSKPFS